MKLSEWQSRYTFPTEIGFYQRDYEIHGQHSGDIGYCYWDGHFWNANSGWLLKEAERVGPPSSWQELPWRGVIEE